MVNNNFSTSKITSICYHGTDSEPFVELDKSKIQKNPEDGDSGYFGWGFYLTTDLNYAKEFGKNILKFKVNIQNPFPFADVDYVDFINFIFKDCDDKLGYHIHETMYVFRLIGENKPLEFENNNSEEDIKNSLHIYHKYKYKYNFTEAELNEIKKLMVNLAKNINNWLNGLFFYFGREVFHYITLNGYDGVIALDGKEVVVYETKQLEPVKEEQEQFKEDITVGADLTPTQHLRGAEEYRNEIKSFLSKDSKVSDIYVGDVYPSRQDPIWYGDGETLVSFTYDDVLFVDISACGDSYVWLAPDDGASNAEELETEFGIYTDDELMAITDDNRNNDDIPEPWQDDYAYYDIYIRPCKKLRDAGFNADGRFSWSIYDLNMDNPYSIDDALRILHRVIDKYIEDLQYEGYSMKNLKDMLNNENTTDTVEEDITAKSFKNPVGFKAIENEILTKVSELEGAENISNIKVNPNLSKTRLDFIWYDVDAILTFDYRGKTIEIGAFSYLRLPILSEDVIDEDGFLDTSKCGWMAKPEEFILNGITTDNKLFSYMRKLEKYNYYVDDDWTIGGPEIYFTVDRKEPIDLPVANLGICELTDFIEHLDDILVEVLSEVDKMSGQHEELKDSYNVNKNEDLVLHYTKPIEFSCVIPHNEVVEKLFNVVDWSLSESLGKTTPEQTKGFIEENFHKLVNKCGDALMGYFKDKALHEYLDKTELTSELQKVKDTIMEVVSSYDTDAKSNLSIKDEVIDYYSVSEDGSERFDFTLYGGNNGGGNWGQYFTDLANCFREIKEKTGWNPRISELNNDIPDDVFWGTVCLFKEEQDDTLEESLRKLYNTKLLKEDISVGKDLVSEYNLTRGDIAEIIDYLFYSCDGYYRDELGDLYSPLYGKWVLDVYAGPEAEECAIKVFYDKSGRLAYNYYIDRKDAEGIVNNILNKNVKEDITSADIPEISVSAEEVQKIIDKTYGGYYLVIPTEKISELYDFLNWYDGGVGRGFTTIRKYKKKLLEGKCYYLLITNPESSPFGGDVIICRIKNNYAPVLLDYSEDHLRAKDYKNVYNFIFEGTPLKKVKRVVEDIRVGADIEPINYYGDSEAFKAKYIEKARAYGADLEFLCQVGPDRNDAIWYYDTTIAKIKKGDYVITVFGCTEPQIYLSDGTELYGEREFEEYGIVNDATIPDSEEYKDAQWSDIDFSIEKSGGPRYDSWDLDFDLFWSLTDFFENMEDIIDAAIDEYEKQINRHSGLNETKKKKKAKVVARDPNAAAMWGRTRAQTFKPKKGKGSFKRHSKHKTNESVKMVKVMIGEPEPKKEMEEQFDYFILTDRKNPKDATMHSSKEDAINEAMSKEGNWYVFGSNGKTTKKVWTKPLKEELVEKVEKHDTLNPKLWNEDNTLKDEVREKILEIAKEFTDGLEQDEIKFNLKDIVLVGSNCSYNYNDKSDLDIHLRMDTDSLECPDNLYPLLYSAYRSLFNGKMDIDFYGIPVEIFVETDDTEQMSPEEPNSDLTESHTEDLDYDYYEVYLEKGKEAKYTADNFSLCIRVPKGSDKPTEEDVEEFFMDNYPDVLGDYHVVGVWDTINDFSDTEMHSSDFETIYNYRGPILASLEEDRKTTAVKSNGIFSVLNNKWIKEPVAADIPELDKEAFDKEFSKWEQRYKKIVAGEDLSKLTEDEILKNKYVYIGPIYRFGRLEKERVELHTTAISTKQAINNFLYQAAQLLGYDRGMGAQVEINKENVVEDEPLPDEEPQQKVRRCPRCGTRLTDNGKCPVCDLGDESFLYEALEDAKIQEIENFIEDIYDLRKTSIAEEGEYGIGNLVFKECRNLGYLDNLKKLKNSLKSRKLSLESINKKHNKK